MDYLMDKSKNLQTVFSRIARGKYFLIFTFLGILLTISLVIGLPVRRSTALLSSTPPTWRGIVPGQTDKQEVIKILGQPDNIVKCEIIGEVTLRSLVGCIFSPLTYEYKDIIPSIPLTPTHKIRFRSEKVWVIIEARYGSPEISVEEFVEFHGLPEEVTWSKLSPALRATLFCDQGMIVQGGEYVAEIYYFQPMPLKQCLGEFDNEVAITDPFPDSHFIGSKNPYNFDEHK